jgi:alkylhydroperoxidase/carboxymuconolactone decarboxylase family protein YurZ
VGALEIDREGFWGLQGVFGVGKGRLFRRGAQEEGKGAHRYRHLGSHKLRIQWHIEQAAAAGASYDEVLETVEVGIEMGGGPATVSAHLALQVMEEVYEK